jgi:hypothetical protein
MSRFDQYTFFLVESSEVKASGVARFLDVPWLGTEYLTRQKSLLVERYPAGLLDSFELQVLIRVTLRCNSV